MAFRLLRELEVDDPATLRQWMRLDKQQYLHLLCLLTSVVDKQDTKMRQAVTVAERLTLTLRYLAKGRLKCWVKKTCTFR